MSAGFTIAMYYFIKSSYVASIIVDVQSSVIFCRLSETNKCRTEQGLL